MTIDDAAERDASMSDEAEPTITVCRDVAGDHVGGPGCWCRPLTMTVSQWDQYVMDHPPTAQGVIVGLDS